MLQNCFIKRAPNLLAQNRIRRLHHGYSDSLQLKPVTLEQVSNRLLSAIRRCRAPTVWKSYVDLHTSNQISKLPIQYHSMAIQTFAIKDDHHYQYQYLKHHKKCVEEIMEIAKANHYKLAARDYNLILNICQRLRDWESAKIHWSKMTAKNEESYNLYMKTALSAHKYEQVFKIFDELLESQVRPNVETYNILIKTNGRMGNATEADRLFKENFMSLKEQPNFITQWFQTPEIAVYTPLSAPLFHKSPPPSKILTPTQDTFEALLEAHGKAKNVTGVYYVHKTLIPQYGIYKNVKIYDALIKAYCVCDDIEGAKNAFTEMQQANIKPNLYIFEHLFKHQAIKMKRPQVAEALIDYMIESYNIQPIKSMYTTLIKLHIKSNRTEEADRLVARSLALEASRAEK
ncbi:hypothetical protein BY458DRAFT_496879 [Sporodiniella umbellata]|nr:hypothetical protein BY458DRAFT_496879 [Sporodiniella umbellata]